MACLSGLMRCAGVWSGQARERPDPYLKSVGSSAKSAERAARTAGGGWHAPQGAGRTRQGAEPALLPTAQPPLCPMRLWRLARHGAPESRPAPPGSTRESRPAPLVGSPGNTTGAQGACETAATPQVMHPAHAPRMCPWLSDGLAVAGFDRGRQTAPPDRAGRRARASNNPGRPGQQRSFCAPVAGSGTPAIFMIAKDLRGFRHRIFRDHGALAYMGPVDTWLTGDLSVRAARAPAVVPVHDRYFCAQIPDPGGI